MIRQSAVRFSTLALLVVAGPSGIAQTQATRTASRSIWDGVYTDAQAQVASSGTFNIAVAVTAPT